MIGLIDYRLSNINSVINALKLLKKEFKIINHDQDISNISTLILPGVGSFKKSDGKFENI